MNRIIDVKIEANQNPSVFCLFDSIETDHLIFDFIQSKCSLEFKSKSILCQNTNLYGGNLLAIDGDLAVWYYYSAINKSNSSLKTLKVRHDDLIIETPFEGLWSSNADAVNLWFPNILIMEIKASITKSDFERCVGFSTGAVSEVVTKMLKSKS